MSTAHDRIRWQKDMLVTRQHLQLLAQRFESLIQSLPARYHPFFWGVSRCECTLKAGLLAVRALEAVMPNGSQAALDPDGAALTLDVGSQSGGQHRTLFVHLALRLDDGDVADRRFIPGEREAAQMVVGDDGLEIIRRRSTLELFAGEAPPASRYTSFPLLELRWENSAYVMTDFMPPTLQVAPESPLALRCAAIPDRLRREAASVVDAGVDTPDAPFSAGLEAQLNPIVCALPPFEVLAAASPHPFALYVELCRLAGAVAVLRHRVMPPQFPAYHHNDARPGFDQVVRYVLGQTADTTPEGVRRFTFEREGRWFRLPPDPEWTIGLDTGSGYRLVLAMRTDMGEALARKWGDNCVIASRSSVQLLLSRRVLGLRRDRVTPGAVLPWQRDLYLFQLSPDADAARPDEALLVLGDLPDVKPSELSLYVIDAEQEHAGR